jgi:multimeric flavodoxin WrbA
VNGRSVVKVLGVMGSPRIGGNTDVLLTEVLRGADLAGAQTERIDLVRYDISPCTSCQECKRTGVCIIDDDAARLIEILLESDVWVLGTPIYWWGPSALLKAFIDRWYVTIHTPSTRARMARRVALVCPFGDSDPGTPRHLVGMIRDIVSYLHGEFTDQLLVTSSGRGEVRKDADAMRRAFELGQRLAAGPSA